jgi:CRP/FNR family transcriptional regulator
MGLGLFVDSPTWPTLLRASRIREYQRGDVLWTAGAEVGALHVVLSGRIRVVGSRRGRQHLIHVVESGAAMGEIPIFDDGTYPAMAICAAASRCWVASASVVQDCLARDPALADYFLRRLSARVRTLIRRLEDQTVSGVRSRIAASLIGLGVEQGRSEVALPSPQSEWAEDLGTVREVLGRELARLVETDHIRRVGRGRVVLMDEEGLERLAVGEDST